MCQLYSPKNDFFIFLDSNELHIFSPDCQPAAPGAWMTGSSGAGAGLATITDTHLTPPAATNTNNIEHSVIFFMKYVCCFVFVEMLKYKI